MPFWDAYVSWFTIAKPQAQVETIDRINGQSAEPKRLTLHLRTSFADDGVAQVGPSQFLLHTCLLLPSKAVARGLKEDGSFQRRWGDGIAGNLAVPEQTC